MNIEDEISADITPEPEALRMAIAAAERYLENGWTDCGECWVHGDHAASPADNPADYEPGSL